MHVFIANPEQPSPDTSSARAQQWVGWTGQIWPLPALPILRAKQTPCSCCHSLLALLSSLLAMLGQVVNDLLDGGVTLRSSVTRSQAAHR